MATTATNAVTYDGLDSEVELTVLMPCLNEAETLAGCIREAQDFFAESGIRGEILVADNGSTDGSQQIAEEMGARVVPVKERGYGAALYFGVLAARGKFVVMGDSDGSYDFYHLLPFVEKLRDGYDLVMGNRFRGGIQPGAMSWKNRYLGNPVLSTIGRLFYTSQIGDFHCGIRGFSRGAFERMDLQTPGMEFASEMVIKASLFKMKVCEVPTVLRPDGRGRPPHLRPWRDGWRHLRFMLLFSPRWLFLYPGLALIVLSLLLGGIVWWGPLPVGGVYLDIHTMAFTGATLLIGVQVVCFAMLSKLFVIREGLMPADKKVMFILRWASLERVLVVGLLFVVIGIAGFVVAVWNWRELGFAELDPGRAMRTVLPSIMALVVGAQLTFNGFFASVLCLRRR